MHSEDVDDAVHNVSDRESHRQGIGRKCGDGLRIALQEKVGRRVVLGMGVFRNF